MKKCSESLQKRKKNGESMQGGSGGGKTIKNGGPIALLKTKQKCENGKKTLNGNGTNTEKR